MKALSISLLWQLVKQGGVAKTRQQAYMKGACLTFSCLAVSIISFVSLIFVLHHSYDQAYNTPLSPEHIRGDIALYGITLLCILFGWIIHYNISTREIINNDLIFIGEMEDKKGVDK